MLGVVVLLTASAVLCYCAVYIAEEDGPRKQMVDAVVLVGSIAAATMFAGWATGHLVDGIAHTAATVVIGFLGGYPTALFLSDRDGSRSELLS